MDALFQSFGKQVAEARANLMFLQVTSAPEGVAEIGALSGVEILVPTHHDMAGPDARHKSVQETIARLAELKAGRMIDTEYGKWYTVGLEITEE